MDDTMQTLISKTDDIQTLALETNNDRLEALSTEPSQTTTFQKPSSMVAEKTTDMFLSGMMCE